MIYKKIEFSDENYQYKRGCEPEKFINKILSCFFLVKSLSVDKTFESYSDHSGGINYYFITITASFCFKKKLNKLLTINNSKNGKSNIRKG